MAKTQTNTLPSEILKDAPAEQIDLWLDVKNLEWWQEQPAALVDHDRLVETVKKVFGKDKAK